MLWEAGYQSPDGTPITDHQSRQAAADTHVALRRLGALVRDNWTSPERPTPDGANFARAALLTWPK